MAIELPARMPVGWNCIISMSTNSAPAAAAMAGRRPAFSSDGELMRYIVAPAPVAKSVGLGRDGDEAAAAVVEQHGADDARAGA